MKFYIRDIDITSGGTPVALVNKEDAIKLDIHVGDRIILKKGKRHAYVIVDIAQSAKVIDSGEIGLFEEVMKTLHARPYQRIEVDITNKPNSIKNIKNKLNGLELKKKDIYEIVKDIVSHRLSDVELAYFISGCYTKGLSMEETVNLTKAIVENGDTIDTKNPLVFDKHCIGGVPGNRTTMALVPILIAGGLKILKTSSRAITSPSGTADTMEVLAKVDLKTRELKKIAQKVGGFMAWGGGIDMASADDKLIRIRHSISIDPEGMLLASIMAKKKAVGSKFVLIDIPYGIQTKVLTKKDAESLRSKFITLGEKLGMKVKVVITDGSEPIGNGIGSSLEARDVLKVLRNEPDCPQDLRKKTLYMAEQSFEMVKNKIKNQTLKKLGPKKFAEHLLESGKAYEKLKAIIKAQQGNPDITPDDIKLGKYAYNYKAPRKGKIISIDNKMISLIARTLGSPVDKGAGLFMKIHNGYTVKKGDVMFIAYAASKEKLEFAKKLFSKAIIIK